MNKEDEKVLQPKIASREVTLHILKAFGLRMSKKLGQNFLIDARIVQGIVEAAEIEPGDRVLEIGPGIGALAGFLYGLINIIQDPFIVHPVQVLFDYPLPYMAMGLAGLWRGHLYRGTALAFLARFLCHVISGVVFFASYAPEGMNPLAYSLAFNATYLIPEFLICCLILRLLPVKRLLAAMGQSR